MTPTPETPVPDPLYQCACDEWYPAPELFWFPGLDRAWRSGWYCQLCVDEDVLQEDDAPELGCSLQQHLDRLAEVDREEWRDIATAPKDGTHILGFNGDAMAAIYFHRNDPDMVVEGEWDLSEPGEHPTEDRWEPTHWMPLPSPPGARAQGEED